MILPIMIGCYTVILGLTIISMIQVENSGEELPELHKAGIWLVGIAWIATLIAGFWLSELATFGLWAASSIFLMALIITSESFTYSKWQTVILVPFTVAFFVSGIIYIW